VDEKGPQKERGKTGAGGLIIVLVKKTRIVKGDLKHHRKGEEGRGFSVSGGLLKEKRGESTNIALLSIGGGGVGQRREQTRHVMECSACRETAEVGSNPLECIGFRLLEPCGEEDVPGNETQLKK